MWPLHVTSSRTSSPPPALDARRVHEVIGPPTSAWVWSTLPRTGTLVWVGAATWTYWRSEASELFVRASAWRERVMAAEAALRCSAVAGVVVDGRGFDMTATRRLQLAAERSTSVVVIVRPPAEAGRTSAAGVRWRLDPVPSDNDRPRFQLQLLRRKGRRLTPGARTLTELEKIGAGHVFTAFADDDEQDSPPHDQQPRRWLLEWEPTGGVRVVDDMGQRSGAAAATLAG